MGWIRTIECFTGWTKHMASEDGCWHCCVSANSQGINTAPVQPLLWWLLESQCQCGQQPGGEHQG